MQVLALLQCRFYEALCFTKLCTIIYFASFAIGEYRYSLVSFKPRPIIQYSFLNYLFQDFFLPFEGICVYFVERVVVLA